MKVNIGIAGLLGFILIILKLTDIINWGWWWVTLPFWVQLVLTLVIIFAFITYKFIILIIANIFKKE